MSYIPLPSQHQPGPIVKTLYWVGVLAVVGGLVVMVTLWPSRALVGLTALSGLNALQVPTLALYLPSLLYGAAGVVTGFMFFGFAKLIDLLHEIRDALQHRQV